MSGIEIDGSHIRAEAMYGQNGSDTPSSIVIGTKIKRSKVAQSILAANNAKGATPPNAADWETRKINAAPIKPAFAQKGAAKGTKVPSGLSYGAPVAKPSSGPATKGTFKR